MLSVPRRVNRMMGVFHNHVHHFDASLLKGAHLERCACASLGHRDEGALLQSFTSLECLILKRRTPGMLCVRLFGSSR
eukprot:1159815-Pelagomonas_calceolata.AAC.12